MNLVGKILLTIAAIQFGFIPAFVDFADTHVFHPDWPAHARFHLVWLLTSGMALASYVLVAVWFLSRDNWNAIRYASVIGCLVLVSFFVAAIFRSQYGGSLSDVTEPIQMFGIDGNVVAFTFALLFQVTGTAIVWRGSAEAAR